MGRKEEIFSKIQLKDYNNDLENVLEAKDFSVDVKNLLLSMLYKIENGYEDYRTIKVNVTSKKYFLKKIIQIVQNECKEIVLVKPMSKESEILEEANANYIIDKAKSKIIVYHNDRMLLEALILLDQQEIKVNNKYELFKDAIANVLSLGNIMSNSEVVRDFNGWSWDITPSQLKSKSINIVYQNLLILMGNSFMQKWITDNEEIEDIDLPNNEILRSKYNSSFGITKDDMIKKKSFDYVSEIEKTIENIGGKELAEEFIDVFFKTVLAINCNMSEKQRNSVIEIQDKLKTSIDKMNDNKKFIEEISEIKKEINKKVRKIDKILNDESLLNKEYEERNKKLSNKDKIFSVSHLTIMLEKEREKYIKEIENNNKKLEPMEFVKIKHELLKQYDFFDEIGLNKSEDGKADVKKQIIELQKVFLKCFEQMVKNAEDKNAILDLIYVFRYYRNIPFLTNNLGKIKETENQIEQIQRMLITKACINKNLIIFSENKELNYQLLKPLFSTKIINLNNIIYVLNYHKGILSIKVYDTNIEEDNIEIKILEKVELSVKLNKKIKVLE